MKVISLSFLLAVTVGAVSAQPAGRATRTSNALDQVLDKYAKLTQRTILRPVTLPALDGPSPKEVSADTNATIRAIEAKLRERGMEVLPDGDRFTRVVPVGWSNSPAAAFLATIKPGSNSTDVLPAAVVDWVSDGADLVQVVQLYSVLRSRSLLHAATLRSPPLKMTTVTPLTRDELGYGLTVMLALNGIAAVDDGPKLVQLVPVEEWKDVQAQAPIAKMGATLLDPRDLLKVGPEAPGEIVKWLTEQYREYLNGDPPWVSRPVDRLVEFYAELMDKRAVPSKSCGRWPVVFEITVPLAREEVCYAIETALRLQGLAVAEVDGNRLTAASLAELRQRKAHESGVESKPPRTP